MLKKSRVLTILLSTAGLVALGGVINAAAACDSSGNCGGTTSGGHQVSVHVSGTLVSGGSSGSSGSSTSSVSVYSPCSMDSMFTGKEMFDIYKGHVGEAHGPNGVKDIPPAGYEKYKDDTTGHWYFPACYLDPKYEAFVSKFLFNPPVYVPAGQAPPTPDVPPEVLLAAAQKAMKIPDPRFDENPHVSGQQATLVTLPTWFWQQPGLQKTGSVTATAGTNSATVTMNLDDVTFSSPDAGSVTCPDGGTPYTPGATSDCVLAFKAAAAAAPVTATSHWAGSWTFNGKQMGAVDPVTGTWQDTLQVLEVQTLVTGVG